MTSRSRLTAARRSGFIAPLAILILTGSLFIFNLIRAYNLIYKPNTDLGGKSYFYLYIPTGTDFSKLLVIFRKTDLLKNEKSFVFVSGKKHYDKRIKPGRYRITQGMNNNDLVNLLRAGLQSPVRLFFQVANTPAELAGKISRQIEADSASLMTRFSDREYLSRFGLDPANVFALFIPNTYEFFWNTNADQFIDRMSHVQNLFWHGERRKLLDSIYLTIPQAVTLASIIEKETNRDLEKPDIAGVYMNRLRKGWPLQADPTIIYLLNDRTVKRVNLRHLKTESPYNTYLYKGLPPGPICLPSVSSIEAVLHFKRHNYMFFCAREDLSGYHNFAVTSSEHQKNARKYQKVLDKMRIK